MSLNDALIEEIVKKTIFFLLEKRSKTHICQMPEDNDLNVRTCIHAILRTFILEKLDLCPNSGKVFCYHGICPYIIGYSMFLWCEKNIHSSRLERSGCSFSHDPSTIAHTRKVVFDYLEKTYGDKPIIETPIWLAVSRVHEYLETIKENSKFQKRKLLCYNFAPTAKLKSIQGEAYTGNRNSLEEIIVPDDTIFESRTA